MKITIHEINRALRNLFEERIKGEYHILVIDTTNMCNLRCRFCYNDWSLVGKPTLMKTDTFRKIIEIMPLIRHQIYLSCNFEPTLHPQFVDFIDMIPDDSRKKCFFTTNLAGKISDETIEKLGKSNIHHINISLDSLDPATYESLRQRAQHKNFMHNLERLVDAFSKNENAPSLRYITVVFKQNYKEVPFILEQCHKKYLSSENEFRNSPDIECNKWPGENNISDGEWNEILNEIKASPYVFSILRYDKSKVKMLYKFVSMLHLQPGISIDAGGVIKINNKPYKDILDNISNPYQFFKHQQRII